MSSYPLQKGGLSNGPSAPRPAPAPAQPGAPGGVPVPVPANDNVPLPANDNAVRRAGYLARGFRFLRKRTPWGLVLGYILYDNWSQPDPIVWKNIGPWRVYATCGNPDAFRYSVTGSAALRFQSTALHLSAANISACLGLQASAIHWGDPVPNNIRSIIYAPHDAIPRGQLWVGFERDITGATTVPEPAGPLYNPATPPTYAPGLPSPDAPYFPENPLPPPWPYPTAPRAPAPRTGRDLGTHGGGTVRGGFSFDVGLSPGKGPDYGPSPSPQPNPHYSEPPPDGTRERKARVPYGLAARFAMSAFNKITETGDFIDALYWAIPKATRVHERKRYKDGNTWKNATISLREKTRMVAKHYREIDIEQALANLVENWAEDRVIGSLGQASKRAIQYLNDQGIYARVISPSRWAWDGPETP